MLSWIPTWTMRYSPRRYPKVEVNMRLVVVIAAFPAEGQPSCEPEVIVVVSPHNLLRIQKITSLDPLR